LTNTDTPTFPGITGVCKHCGRKIHLSTVIPHWVLTATGNKDWKCPAPGFPVRGHAPKEEKKGD